MLNEIYKLLARLKLEIAGCSNVSFVSDGVILYIAVDWILGGKTRRIVKTFDPDRLIDQKFDDEKNLILFTGYCKDKIANTTELDDDCYTLV